MKRWSRIATINAEPALLLLPVAQRSEMVLAMEKRHRLRFHLLPALISFPAGFMWGAIVAWLPPGWTFDRLPFSLSRR